MGAGAAQGGPGAPGNSMMPNKGTGGMGAAPAGGVGGMGGLGGMYGGMPNPFAAQQQSQMQSLIGPAPMQGLPVNVNPFGSGAPNMNMMDTRALPPSATPFGQADMARLSQMSSMLGGQPQAPMQGLGAYGPQTQGLGSLIPPMGGMGGMGGGVGGPLGGGQLRNV